MVFDQLTNEAVMKYLPIIFLAVSALVAGCSMSDDNDMAVYSKDSGLPVNCRAYVQVAVNDYRAGKYTTDAIMSGLERNCGENGWSWKNKRVD